MKFKRSNGYLIHELAQKFTAEFDQILYERYGIGFSQFKVLLEIEETPGIQQKAIATALAQSEASVSRQVGILIDKNLAEIGEAEDNRRHPIYLTARGEEMIMKTSSALTNYQQDILFSKLSKKDQDTLSRILSEL